MNLAQDFTRTSPSYPVYKDLVDKVVVVTGGAGGIGAETVRAFADQGSRVVFVDINEAAAKTLQDSCETAKHTPLFVKWDLSNIRGLESLTDSILAQTGTIEILVNNAANDMRIEVGDADFYDEYMRSFDLNIHSPVNLTLAVLKKSMVPAGRGNIVTVSSVHAQMASDAKMLPYGMSKSALEHFIKWIPQNYGHQDIRSNGIEPGWIATEKQMNTVMNPDSVRGCLEKQSVKRIGHERDIAGTILILASQDASGFTTGQVWRVDGGTLDNRNSHPLIPENIADPTTRQCLGLGNDTR